MNTALRGMLLAQNRSRSSTNTGSRRSRAFTLIELLIVIVISGMLVAILLPALQSVRATARNSICRTHLRQIGLAMLSFEAGRRSLPASRNGDGGWSAQALITPFLEKGAIYAAIDFSKSYRDVRLDGQPISAHRVPVYNCPSEPRTALRVDGSYEYAPVNYAVNMGTWMVWDPVTRQGGNGLFQPEHRLRLRQVTDGHSHTTLFAEVTTYHPYYRNVDIGDASLPTTPSEVCGYGGSLRAQTGHTEWTDGRVHQTGFTTTFPPNFEVLCGKYDADFNSQQEGLSETVKSFAAVTARSHHSGHVNVVQLDGSVLTVPNEVELRVWQAMSTRSGNEACTFLPLR